MCFFPIMTSMEIWHNVSSHVWKKLVEGCRRYTSCYKLLPQHCIYTISSQFFGRVAQAPLSTFKTFNEPLLGRGPNFCRAKITQHDHMVCCIVWFIPKFWGVSWISWLLTVGNDFRPCIGLTLARLLKKVCSPHLTSWLQPRKSRWT